MINLFILDTCPYCKKVIDYLKTTSIKFNLLDINNPHNYEEMIRLGGKRQVPFLFDDKNNVTMYESSDIIEYLKTL